MRNNYLKYLLILLIPALLFSCSRTEKEDLLVKGMGLLSLSLEQNLDPVLMGTKAEGEEVVFRIDILKNNVVTKTIEDHRTLEQEPLALRAGTYKVVAYCGEDVSAGFEAPYYMGETTIDVVIGEEVTANITCILSNVKTSVSFSNAVTSNFTVYDVTITNGEGSLVFDKANNSKNGYFKATGTLDWSIKLVNTDGQEYEIKNTITNVKPREYYKLLFDVNGNSSSNQGGAGVTISYDTDLEAKEHNVSINLNKKAMPTIIEASGADITSVLRAPQGAGVLGLLNVTAMAGISNFKFIHSNAALSSLGIPEKIVIPGTDQTSLNASGIYWSEIQQGVTTSMTFDFRTLLAEKLPLGEYEFLVSVLDAEQQYVEIPIKVKVVPDVEVSTISVDAWAKFAYVYAQYNTEEEPEGLGIKYKKASDSDWSDFTGTLTKDGAKFSAKVTGLEPNTAYQFKAVTTKDDKEDNVIAATTERADQLPYMNMDVWFQSGDAWYPGTDAGSLFWDSANGGTADYGYVPTVPEETNVISGKAAKLSTIEAKVAIITKLAAGNLYTGEFKSVVMTGGGGAELDFGRPYTCRPTSFKGYVDYRPAKVSKYCDSKFTSLLSGKDDHGQIFVMLTDWTAPFRVKTTEGVFTSEDDPSVIAYGSATYTTNTNGYVEFNIPIEYRDNRKPSYILVVCAASKYGDYFTGGVGSVMYVDEMSFGFE